MLRTYFRKILPIAALKRLTIRQYDTAKAEHKKRIRELRAFIKSQPSEVTEFDESLVKKLLERVNVHEDYLEFRFKSGVMVGVEK